MNPITDLAAADFLQFYVVLIGLTLGLTWWRRKRADESSRAVEWPTRSPDPYEVACLRGGSQEVALVAVVSLMDRGYLEFRSGDPNEPDAMHSSVRTIGHAVPTRDPAALRGIDRIVFDWFEQDAVVADIRWDRLATALEVETLPYEARMQANQLVISDVTRARIVRMAWQAAAVIASVGAMRLAVGVSRGRPVGFLVVLGIAGLLGTVWLGKSSRLSARGRRYLEGLRRQTSHSAADSGSATTMMAAALGVAALAGTPMAFLAQSKAAKSSDAGGCGGGCGATGGGSSDGGGGCGGGCGGCGG